MLPGSPKKEDTRKQPRLLPRHSTMQLLGPSLLLLVWWVPEYLAFSDSTKWRFEHPHTLYSWDGACVWIPCQYTTPLRRDQLDNLILYSNYEYDDTTKNFKGPILYEKTKSLRDDHTPERVQFLGDQKSNCTISINPVFEKDNGWLGLRLTTKAGKWMEKIDLNVSNPAAVVPGGACRHLDLPDHQDCLHPEQAHLPAAVDAPRQESDLPTLGPQSKADPLRGNGVAGCEAKMSGEYHCEAFNDLGSGQSDEVFLQVYYAPEPSRVEIVSSPAKEGNQVEMTCMSRANPLPTNYTWYHNKLEVPGRTNKTFQIPAVLLSHAGQYSCLAKNRLGAGPIGQETELDVQYAPKEVTTVIQNPTRIREGDTVTLFCNYSSSNPRVTRYEWNLQGSWKEQSPGVLIIQKVAWDARPITCAACNQWCSWAPSVNLDVQHAPKDVRVQQISPPSEIHSGHRVLLGCNFSSSRPRDVRFFWKRNGIFLKEGKELSFDSISPEDAGNYNCFINNSIGQTMSEARRLQVLYAPRMLRVAISPKDQVMEGKKAVLTCESDANPPIFQYTWFDWNNQNLHHYDQMLRLDPVKIQHSGAYWCEATNQLGRVQSPPSTLTVYYSPETIGRRVAVGVGFCLATVLLVFWGVKLQRSWKRIRSQQGLQESSSGQSFFVRKQKVRRAPLSEDPHSLGCYNPVMEDAISYATLRFPFGETDTPRLGDAGTLETESPSPNRDDTVTYSVLQKCREGDYENVLPDSPEDEGIHYSELVHLGLGKRPVAQEAVEYVTLKH
ncbi:B-cell receptor CD22 isoform X9 [Eumetopias jubatus]|uniref:B-cell receptor CD22 isoform X9 n=1 Tax=Eumetopias jubatus TaxID=34886 RepID=UPI001016B7B4|nr:B-cell receptor CD22 isoform X9 [Eumetopias jubatus]